MDATDDDIRLLRDIVSSGGRRYTSGNVDRHPYERLEKLGWLVAYALNLSNVYYEVTADGELAAKTESWNR